MDRPTSLTKSGQFTVNEILSLANNLGVQFKSLKIIDKNLDDDDAGDEAIVRISKISQNFLDSMVPNLLEIHNNNTTAATETVDSSNSRIDLSSDGMIDTSSDSDTYTDTEDDWRREDSQSTSRSRSRDSPIRSSRRYSRLRMDKNPKKAPKNIKNNERLEDALKLKINGSLACNSCLPVIRKFKSQEALDQHCKAKHGLVKQLGTHFSYYHFKVFITLNDI